MEVEEKIRVDQQTEASEEIPSVETTVARRNSMVLAVVGVGVLVLVPI